MQSAPKNIHVALVRLTASGEVPPGPSRAPQEFTAAQEKTRDASRKSVSASMAPRLPRIGQASIFADESAAEASHASHTHVADLSARGKHEEARNALSHMLATERVASGVHSPEYRQALASATRLCNELALGAMERTSRQRSGDGFDVALGYLRKALALGTGTPPLQALTLNNLAVYYNGTGQPRQALRCLQRTRRMCRRPDDDERAELDAPDDDVSTHALLNMTTVLAALGRHHEAMQVAVCVCV